MKRSSMVLAAAGILALRASAYAAPLTEATVWDFVKANHLDCKTCHDVNKKVVGPAWRDVGKKYAGQDVRKKLIAKVKKGGSGVWGPIPMSPHPQVPDEVLGKLVDFELSLH